MRTVAPDLVQYSKQFANSVPHRKTCKLNKYSSMCQNRLMHAIPKRFAQVFAYRSYDMAPYARQLSTDRFIALSTLVWLLLGTETRIWWMLSDNILCVLSQRLSIFWLTIPMIMFYMLHIDAWILFLYGWTGIDCFMHARLRLSAHTTLGRQQNCCEILPIELNEEKQRNG